MKENVKKLRAAESSNALRLQMNMLCALLLFCAYVFGASFYLQLLVFAFSLFVSKEILKEGFEALSAFSPTAKSLVFLSALSALLHGVSTFDVKNCLFFLASALALSELGDFLKEKHFAKSDAYRIFADRLCRFFLPLSLVLLIFTVIANIVSGKSLIFVITQAFLFAAMLCPCTAVLSPMLFAVLSAKKAAECGVSFLCSSVPEKLGCIKEMIVEQRGIVTEKNYSLYDVYVTDGDKIGFLAIASAMELHFDHPFASAVISAAKSVGAPRLTAENCCEICGRGVSAFVGGDKYFLGNKKLLRDKKIAVPDAVAQADFGIFVPLYIAKNDKFFGFMLMQSKMTFAAAETLNAIKALGVRTILIADDERDDWKRCFDILLPEREKVLQEFKKGAKIKAMTVTEKAVAKADVVAVTCGAADADLAVNSLHGAYAALVIGKKTFSLIKVSLILPMLLSLAFASLAALGTAFLPTLSLAISALPLALCIGILRMEIPKFTSSEEDEMFGKVNYTMKINGMSCTHCSARVKTALESLRGVSADVSLEEKVARIKCPASTAAETLEKAVTDVGFAVVSTERV